MRSYNKVRPLGTHGTNEAEAEQLLAREAQQDPPNNSGWLASIRQTAVNAAKKLTDGAKYVAQHPVTAVTSVLTAAPTALNALASPSGKGPDQIGAEWWEDMSNLQRAYSVCSATSSLLINTVLGAVYLPAAAQKLKTSLKTFAESPKALANNLASLILGFGGAAGAAAISYNAFLWLPYGTFAAIPFALLAFTIVFASRYIGIKNVFKRFANIFNQDAKTQTEFADRLDHINEAYLEQLQAELSELVSQLQIDPEKPLSQEQYEQLVVDLCSKINELQHAHPDLINEKVTSEYVKQYAGLVFDLTFALTCIAVPAYITFSQKGFDAVQIIAKLATGNSLENLDRSYKLLIGVLPGVASALFYGDSAMDIRNTLVETVKFLYNNPEYLPRGIILLAANGIAANSMTNIATNLLKKENIYNLTNNALGTTYTVFTTLSGVIVNLNATLSKGLFSQPEPAAQDITIQNLASRLHKTNNEVISKDTAESLRRLSIWKKIDQDIEHADDTYVQVLSTSNSVLA